MACFLLSPGGWFSGPIWTTAMRRQRARHGSATVSGPAGGQAPVRDLALAGFLAAFIALGFRRPFLFVLAYAYVDIVSPQHLSYYLLNAIPISLICFVLALGGWLLADNKRG